MEKLREKASGLPMLPGVYIMKDRQSRVLYVGKAKQLRNRVGSYFFDRGAFDAKTDAMTSKIFDFDVIIVKSEFEALVLENSLIKHHMPKYNVLLRDDKGFPYIRVDMESDYPAFKIVSKSVGDGALYLGPYSGRALVREAIETVCKAFKLPTCGKNLARIVGKERPCLNYHMGACRAFCQSADLAGEYREAVESAVSIFQGKTAGLIEKLKKEMEEDAEKLEFERAAEKRDRLRAVEMLEKKQFVIAGARADTDVIGFFRGDAKSCFTVLHYIEGKLISKDAELFDIPIEDDGDAISGIVRQYYERRGTLPKTICLPFCIPDEGLLEQFFSEKAGFRVHILAPQRGEKAQMVETANINAREEAQRASTFEEKTLKTMRWLQNAMKLEKIPERIEAFDVSNTGGADTVASMIVFVKGRPYKKDYRRFKIKTVEGQNDYQSMAEAVSRRFTRFIDEEPAENSPKDGRLRLLSHAPGLPDIILVDGGAGHASIVRAALDNAGIDPPVFGMVKDDRHRTRALVSHRGEEIGLAANPAVFALIGTIQEEAHRFAVEYHRSLRSKRSNSSKLDKIKGVGLKRRNDLLKSFGSVKAVAAATVEELSKVVPKNVAEEIYRSFNQEGTENESY